jgi:hypothetical protein
LEATLEKRVTEVFFLHGTKRDAFVGTAFEPGIREQGLDFRTANSGVLGQGLYFSPDPDLAHHYTDEDVPADFAGDQTEHTMLLCRVLLGKPCRVQGELREQRRPLNGCDSHFSKLACHARIAECDADHWAFCIYDNHHCYVEFEVAYTATRR